MSVTVLIVPIVVGGWPMLCTLASAVATGLGYRLMQNVEKVKKETAVKEIEITDEASKVIEESIKPEEELVFVRSGIAVTFKKDLRDRFTICVKGEKKSEEELRRVGKLFLNRIKQQFAYKIIKEEMTRRGFNMVEENIDGKNIRIKLRKFL